MPAIARVPISHAVLGADGKPDKEKSLSFKAGDYVSDDDLKTLGDDKRLMTVPHNEHICPRDCPDNVCGDQRSARANAIAKAAQDATPAATPKKPDKPISLAPSGQSEEAK